MVVDLAGVMAPRTPATEPAIRTRSPNGSALRLCNRAETRVAMSPTQIHRKGSRPAIGPAKLVAKDPATKKAALPAAFCK
ncbi:hypothetical protein NMG46_10275 [Mesorhizobium sp. LMG 17147]|uniref:hypothetical protein n=1 Tax=Mesorhizobium sp. LMG 17147 TaxID=2963091 RepID=UPI0020C974FD|nr:hypothetical protein [Mesorhizobium sp. LMG 17147]MCP9230629.1 hypothetical protein [Mesorhizobium sp. LMG 17147]